MEPVFGLMVTWRPYSCQNCQHVQMLSTNHTSTCFHFCDECSWKPSWRGDGRYSDPEAPERMFPMFGRTYRQFDYAGDGSDIVPNPHARSAAQPLKEGDPDGIAG